MFKIPSQQKAILAVFIFFIILIKDFLVSYLELIPARSALNRNISWFVIFPLSILCIILIGQVGYGMYIKRKKREKVSSLYLVLLIPILLYFLYFTVQLVFIIIKTLIP